MNVIYGFGGTYTFDGEKNNHNVRAIFGNFLFLLLSRLTQLCMNSEYNEMIQLQCYILHTHMKMYVQKVKATISDKQCTINGICIEDNSNHKNCAPD